MKFYCLCERAKFYHSNPYLKFETMSFFFNLKVNIIFLKKHLLSYITRKKNQLKHHKCKKKRNFSHLNLKKGGPNINI